MRAAWLNLIRACLKFGVEMSRLCALESLYPYAKLVRSRFVVGFSRELVSFREYNQPEITIWSISAFRSDGDGLTILLNQLHGVANASR
jgi:hypothetical protein